MKRLLLAVLSVLCLCGCENKKDREDVNVVAKKDMTSVCEEEIKGFSVLGIQMGSDIGCVRRVLAKRVDDVWTDEAIIIKGQQVGPTKFNEIRFRFGSFHGVSSLEEIELWAELEKEDARYFVYYWNKEFGDKYKCTVHGIDIDDVWCDCFYSVGGSTSISIKCKKSEYGGYYDCRIRFIDWKAMDKPYEKFDSVWLNNYFDSIAKNKYVFTEY